MTRLDVIHKLGKDPLEPINCGTLVDALTFHANVIVSLSQDVILADVTGVKRLWHSSWSD